MKKQQYIQAVSSIHWSSEKRAAIEDLLQQQPKSAEAKKKAKLLRATAKQHRMDVRQSGRMKREGINMADKNVRRTVYAGFLATLLIGVGAVAAGVSYAKKHPQILETTWKNGVTLRLTQQESDEPSTANSFYPNSNQFSDLITPAENGWFFRKEVPFEYDFTDQFGTFQLRDYRHVLTYADAETGETVPLCARANCLHDGNTYCTATTDTYMDSYITYYDGYLYSMTTKYLHPETRRNYLNDSDVPTDEMHQVLLRYSPDGTEITELADFGTGRGNSKCIVHRGYVWCIVQLQNQGEEIENPITHNTTRFESGGWQLWAYELATGQSSLMYDAMGDPAINHINNAPRDLFCAGDFLYFSRAEGDWSGAYGFCRISLLTGEVTSGEEEIVIQGRHFVCQSKTHAIRSHEQKEDDGSETIHYYLIDLETAEEKELFSTVSVLDTYIQSGLKVWKDQFTIQAMDENYIYAQTYANGVQADDAEYDIYILIFDYDGNLVREVGTGFKYLCKTERSKKNEDDANRNGGYTLQYYTESCRIEAVYHGVIYLKHSRGGDDELLKKNHLKHIYDMLYINTDDLLNGGEPEWKLAYSLTEEVQDDAE